MGPSGRAPSVFVSSTFYDLAQIRADLRDFITSLNFEPVLSEQNNFPIDPDSGTVENCLRAVENRADIFLLIIGGRYGSTNDEGKSITNLEYLRAKVKHIPIYVFVSKQIIDMLPVWRDNPQGNFQSVVDSVGLFEFVESIRESGGTWVFPFEYAQDVISTLRQQFAFLFMESLNVRSRFRDNESFDVLSQLHGEALRLALEKPLGWVYRLFSQVLSEELHAASNLKQDLRYGIAFGEGKTLSEPSDIKDYILSQNQSLMQVSSGLDRLINEALPTALQEVQSTGNPERLVYVAKKAGEAYRSSIAWTLDYRRIHVEDKYQNLISMASNLSSNMIREIEEFSELLQSELKNAISTIRDDGGSVNLELTLTLTVPDIEPLNREMKRRL